MSELQRLLLVLFAILSTLAAGCSGGSLAVRKIYQSEHCPITKTGLSLITSDRQLVRVVKPHLRPIPTDLTDAQAPDQAGELKNAVDFLSEQVILIAQGQKPSAGYGVFLAGAEAQMKKGTLHLPVQFRQPSADRFHAQVLTSPCLVVSFPKGDYERIAVAGLTLNINSVENGKP